jgi:chromosome segregation ATPase
MWLVNYLMAFNKTLKWRCIMESKLYSVNDLSEMLNISKQAIYKKKKTDPSLKPFWTTVNNVLHLDKNGLSVLKAKINFDDNNEKKENIEVEAKLNNSKNNSDNVAHDLNNVENNLNFDLLIGSYKEHIEDLRSQLNSKDNQINKLTETISTQSELLKNMQVLLKENKDQIKALEEGKKTIFNKWFKKR